MPSATPKRDVSHSWPVCRRRGCGWRHVPEAACPPRGVWLVARFCPACSGAVYCVRHCSKEYGRPVLTVVRSERTQGRKRESPAPEVANLGPGDHDDAAKNNFMGDGTRNR